MFCIVKGFESLGRAKVLDASGVNWTVEYFDSPSQIARDIRAVPKARVILRKLGVNTRVYYRNEAIGQWLVGRVLQDLGDGVEVRFSDKKDIFLDYEHLFVRCKKPIADPVAYLANVITETPQYAEARSGFLASYISQRGAAWGISALLSSVIELESHQINVIRRILSDPSQRYLLADEVGLGKTIEAGVVIRQAVLDNPRNHRVIVLVPRVLVQQWRRELTQRFGLADFIEISVFVVAQESLDGIEAHLVGATLLVIDEAHHVASGIDGQSRLLYDIVRVHSPNIERLLLLSATPVLRNELGFLRMLHLLDPIVYGLDDEDNFRAKINHRQVLAEAVASLDPQNALYLDSILDELVEKLPIDERLLELVGALKQELVGLPDENDPDLIEAIRMLRAHLSETYRLHRRILRNRRKQVTGLTPNRAGATTVLIPETQLERVESLLENWRISATMMDDGAKSKGSRCERVEFFWGMISALLTEPGAIKSICEVRVKAMLNAPKLSFEDEVPLLRELAELVDQQQWLRNRLNHLIHDLPMLLASTAKVVIFCSQQSTADAVFTGLRIVLQDNVVRHEIIDDNEFDNDEPLWSKFNSNNNTVRVIVCDHSAEEGINLQGGHKLIIHFDLPAEPNRIEQRMGRVDRYGSGYPIQSLVMLDEGSKYQSNWFSVLDNALGVFGRSISSLQYLVEDQMQQLKGELYASGVEAIEALADRLSGATGKVAKELKLIDQQDGLDELSPLSERDLGKIFDIDEEWEDIRRTTLHWACDTLLFAQVAEPKLVPDRPTDTPFRFQYRIPGRGGQVTLIPLSGFLDDFLGGLDYEDPRSNSAQPLSYPHLSRRQSAVKSGIRLIRYGSEFIEALKSFSDLDDRGRSFAMWRQVHERFVETENQMYFRFDFLIETRLDDATIVLKRSPATPTDTSIAAIARRGDALFPPLIVQVWIDEEGDEPSAEFVGRYLTSTYDKHGKNGIHIDTNLKSLRFRSLMEVLPDAFANWSERCMRMRDRAKAILVNRPILADAKAVAIKRARIEDEVREAQLATRIRMLDGVEADSEREQLALEAKLNAALYRGIEIPSIKVDVAGVVVLSGMPFPSVN